MNFRARSNARPLPDMFGPMESVPDRRPDPRAEARFAELYRENSRDVLAYAVRRTATSDDAADLVAETFLVAWRRGDEVPAGDEARLWLFGVARLVLANQQRGDRRRTRLAGRLQTELTVALDSEPEPEADCEVMEMLDRMAPNDREVLLLAGWEELEVTQIAEVIGISQVAARSRLHRARRRLGKMLADAKWQDRQNYLGEMEVEGA
jgi:RNA polymerase sigma factor (sigma-70 family)